MALRLEAMHRTFVLYKRDVRVISVCLFFIFYPTLVHFVSRESGCHPDAGDAKSERPDRKER